MSTKFSCIPKLGKEGGGVVWDKDANAVLARFDENGEFATDDEAVIGKLKDMGFKVIGTSDAEATDTAPARSAKKGKV